MIDGVSFISHVLQCVFYLSTWCVFYLSPYLLVSHVSEMSLNESLNMSHEPLTPVSHVCEMSLTQSNESLTPVSHVSHRDSHVSHMSLNESHVCLTRV